MIAETPRLKLINNKGLSNPGRALAAAPQRSPKGYGKLWVTPEGSDVLSLPHFDLRGAIMPHADFAGAHLHYSSFALSICRFSDFTLCDLSCALISHSDFNGSKFKNAVLEFAGIDQTNLSSTNFQGANLSGADLRHVDFRWSDLRGANFTDCGIHKVDFFGAAFDETTKLPFSTKEAIKRGMVFIHEDLDSVS